MRRAGAIDSEHLFRLAENSVQEAHARRIQPVGL